MVAEKDAILIVCDRLSKMTYFVVTMEKMLAEGLTRPFRDNVWRLYRLPESMVLDRRPQFAAELTKELNEILDIKTKLSTAFHPQMDEQIECMNQKDWPEQLASAKFAINNKVYSITKMSPFMANYGRELKMEADIRKKGKI